MQPVRYWALGFALLMAWLLLISVQAASQISLNLKPDQSSPQSLSVPFDSTKSWEWWHDQATLFQIPILLLLMQLLVGLAIAAGCHGLSRRQSVGTLNFAIHAGVAMALIGSIGIGQLHSSIPSVCCLLLLFYVIILDRNAQESSDSQKQYRLHFQEQRTNRLISRFVFRGLLLLVVALWSNLHHSVLLGCAAVWIYQFSRVLAMKDADQSGREAKFLKRNAITVSLVALIGTTMAPGGIFQPIEWAKQIYQGLPSYSSVETIWAFDNPVTISLFVTTLAMAGWSLYQAARWPLFESLAVLLMALFTMIQIEWLPLYLVIWLIWIPPLWNQQRSWFFSIDWIPRWYPQFVTVALTAGMVMLALVLNTHAEILTIPPANRTLSQQTKNENSNSKGQDKNRTVEGGYQQDRNDQYQQPPTSDETTNDMEIDKQEITDENMQPHQAD